MKLSLATSFIIAAVGSAGPCVLVTNATEHHPRYVASAAGLKPSAVQTDAATGVGNPKPEGPYTAKYDRIAHMPGLTMGGKTSAVIVYPSVLDEADAATANTTSFPLLSFAHATYIGGLFPPTDKSYKTLMDKVVSYGFIVVAPETCSAKECFSNYAKDQVAAIGACKANPGLHKALRAATFDKVGVFGHSMGAMATLASAGGSNTLSIDPAAHGIVAAASMHPCQDIYLNGAKVRVPTLISTGSSDTICADGCAERYYGAMPAGVNKALLSVKGATHFDPTDGRPGSLNRGDEAVALYLACHVRGEHCNEVYGALNQALCGHIEGGVAAKCKVKGTAPSGPAHGRGIDQGERSQRVEIWRGSGRSCDGR